MKKKNGPWTILGSAEKFKNDFIEVVEDDVIQPDGQKGKYATVKMTPGVCVLPVDDDERVYLVRQFRYAVGRESLEVIAGGIEGEEPLEAARREAKEELGIEAEEWIELGAADVETSIVNCPARFFVARKLKIGRPDREGSEEIETVTMNLKEAAEKVLSGEIRHALSALLILKARHRLKEI
jgi:8-oxo-dGTP pyrophosphatase MutT (NUDIX family)